MDHGGRGVHFISLYFVDSLIKALLAYCYQQQSFSNAALTKEWFVSFIYLFEMFIPHLSSHKNGMPRTMSDIHVNQIKASVSPEFPLSEIAHYVSVRFPVLASPSS